MSQENKMVQSKDVDTKHRIQQAALELFANNGYAAVSIRQIASSAQVNVASINYYYKSKLELFLSLIKYGYEKWDQMIQQWDNLPFRKIALNMIDAIQNNQDNIYQLKIFHRFLLDDLIKEKESHLFLKQTGIKGPPGFDVILKSIRAELPNIGEKEALMISESFFMIVIQQTLIINKEALFDIMPLSKYFDDTLSMYKAIMMDIIERLLTKN